MGMFDSIYFDCLKCGNGIEAQSKSGECVLNKYYYDSVPLSVALDANRHAPFECENCGAKYEFEEPTVKLKIRRIIT